MNVAIVSTQGTHGGAARAAYRLHLGMLENNVESHYLVKKQGNSTTNTHSINVKKTDQAIEMMVQKFYIDANRSDLTDTYFSFNYTNANMDNNYIDQADIVNLHWVDKFLNDQSLKTLIEKQKQIVWTLHDEKPYTGGCHYTAGCTNFTKDCQNCPQLEYDPFDITYRVLEAKKTILKNANLTIVTPSIWLADEARKSALFKHCRIETIPNSIETEVFKPQDKLQAKSELGIPEKSFTLMFGAHDNKAKRKGFTYLMDAIKLCLQNEEFDTLCKSKKINIVTVGLPNQEISTLPIEVHNMGFINNDEKMAKIYNATNLFILPSLEDNLPNTMIEAFACATPVVGFKTGGIPDVVQNNINGYIVEKEDSKALSEAILKSVFDPEKMKEFGLNSRKLIENKFKLSHQTQNYFNLFEDILKNQTDKKKIILDPVDENYLDPIIGYAYRNSLNDGHHFHNSSDIYSFLKEVSKHKLLKEPIKKLLAYKKLMQEFGKTKK